MATFIGSKEEVEEEEEEEQEEGHSENAQGSDNENPTMSSEEAYRSANKLYDWLMTRWDATPQDLHNLGCIRELSADIYASIKMYNYRK